MATIRNQPSPSSVRGCKYDGPVACTILDAIRQLFDSSKTQAGSQQPALLHSRPHTTNGTRSAWSTALTQEQVTVVRLHATDVAISNGYYSMIELDNHYELQ